MSSVVVGSIVFLGIGVISGAIVGFMMLVATKWAPKANRKLLMRQLEEFEKETQEWTH